MGRHAEGLRGGRPIGLVQAEHRLRRTGVPLAENALAIDLGDALGLTAQHRHFIRREEIRKEKVAVTLKLGQLFRGQFHDPDSSAVPTAKL